MADGEDFFWFLVVGFIFGGVFSEVMTYIDKNEIISDSEGYFDAGCVIYVLSALVLLGWINLREETVKESRGTEYSYTPSKSWSGPEVESRKCEEKWDGRCSGRANVIKVGKWMCYHCRDEYEDHWDHDDAGG